MVMTSMLPILSFDSSSILYQHVDAISLAGTYPRSRRLIRHAHMPQSRDRQTTLSPLAFSTGK